MMRNARRGTIAAAAAFTVATTVGSASGSDGADGAVPGTNAWRLAVEAPGTPAAWVSSGGRPAFGYGVAPQHLLAKLPPGEARDPDLDFRDFADWVGTSGVSVVRSYPPSVIVGPRWLDLFERSATDPDRFDLERFSDRWFDRLREACTLLRDAGVFVHLQMWQAVAWKKAWDDSYYHPDRNVNPEIAGLAGPGDFVVKPGVAPELLAHQKEHVRRLLDATGDLGNVYYDVMNEIGNGTGVNAAWVEAILDEIEAWELRTGLDVLVGLNDEGQDRRSTGHALSNPRFEIAFLDRGDPAEHVRVRERFGKPTFGIRNLDWHPWTRTREYFAIEKDLSILPDAGLHSRSLRMYWRLFLAKVPMNPGYADYGSRAYRTAWTVPVGFPPPPRLGIGAGAWERARAAPGIVEEAPGESFSCLVAEAAGDDPGWAIVLAETTPGESGKSFPPGRLRLLASAVPPGDLRVEARDLRHATWAPVGFRRAGDALEIETPPFTDGLVVVVAPLEVLLAGDPGERVRSGRPDPEWSGLPGPGKPAPSGAISAAGSEASGAESAAPEIVVVRVDSDRVVLWAKGCPPEGPVEWEQRSADATWKKRPGTRAYFSDDGLEEGVRYEYRVRSATPGHPGAHSRPVAVEPRGRSLRMRLQVFWWRYSERLLLTVVVAAAGFLAAGVAWALRVRRAAAARSGPAGG